MIRLNGDGDKVRLLDLSTEQLRAQMTAWGQPAYRAAQLRTWLYQHLATSPAQMSSLPANLRARLGEESQIGLLTQVTETTSSNGETIKTLFRLEDGQLIETVLMRYRRRRTVCISSQAGCAMGCSFCATAQMGLQRNLTAGEIVDQVLHFQRWLRTQGDPTGITNVVVMGMGEPLANYPNLRAALQNLTAADGLGLGARRITVSTVGIVPAMDRFTAEGWQIGLAVSLHAPNDALRSQLVPLNLRYPVADLMAACRRYVEQSGRRITFEYALMQGINDGPQVAQELASLLKGLLCHVNLIPLNPVAGSPYQPSTRADAESFAEALRSAGIATTLRVRRGIDIDAGCGQLRARVATSG